MIGVSACLAGINCRYNAQGLTHPLVKGLREPFIPLCPEVLAGFSTPRSPCEMVGGTGQNIILGRGKIINSLKQDITEQMVKGAQIALEKCKEQGISEVILQQGSPSCGCGWVYNGTFTGQKIEGDGVFTALLKQNGIKCIPLRGEKITK